MEGCTEPTLGLRCRFVLAVIVIPTNFETIQNLLG